MPGLLGVAGAGQPDLRRGWFDRGLAHLRRHAGLSARTTTDAPGSMWLAHVWRNRSATVSSDEVTAAPRVLFHGVLHNERALRASMASEPGVDALLTALYSRDGLDFIGRLQGEFCLAVLDPATRTLACATDPLGSYPLYWAEQAGGIVVASEVGAVLAATRTTPTVDARAVADYLTIGAIFGNRTLATEVTLVPPGSVLRFTEGAAPAVSTYARLESLFHTKANQIEEYYERLESTFREVVSDAATCEGVLGLSLSGGLDSRGLLAAIPGDRSRLRTYTLGVDGCADQVIGAQLAARAGTQHRFFQLNASYLKDFLPNMREMVSLTDGMYLSHGLTEMLAVTFLEETGIDVLLRGHGGELAKATLAWPLHTDARVHAMQSTDQLVPYLSARANYVSPHLPLRDILTPAAYARGGDGSRASFAEALQGTGLSPAEACSFLYVRELNRRFTIPSLDLFRVHREVRLPYLDIRFLTALLGAPAVWRDGTAIHRRLVAAGGSDLLRIRNSNTSARVNAGPLEERVFEKMGEALKRLNVYGYRHYHNFDGWMRSMLLTSVEQELLRADARVQALVSRQTLTSLAEATRAGSSDHSYLLQVLLIIELWMQQHDAGSIG